MNVLIIDMNKVDLATCRAFVDKAAEIMNDDVIVLPKGVDILQDVPIGWLKDIKDRLDKKIKKLESD